MSYVEIDMLTGKSHVRMICPGCKSSMELCNGESKEGSRVQFKCMRCKLGVIEHDNAPKEFVDLS